MDLEFYDRGLLGNLNFSMFLTRTYQGFPKLGGGEIYLGVTHRLSFMCRKRNNEKGKLKYRSINILLSLSLCVHTYVCTYVYKTEKQFSPKTIFQIKLHDKFATKVIIQLLHKIQVFVFIDLFHLF